MQETLGLTPGLERSPGEGKGRPPQYSGLENSMDTYTTERLSLSLHIQGITFIKVVEVVVSQEFPEIIYRIWHETVLVYFFRDRCL